MRGKLTATLVCATTIALAGCGGGAEDGAASTSSASTSTAAEPPERALAEWGRDELADSLGDLGDSFVWIGSAIKGMDFADARAGCRDLSNQVEALDAKLPSPDATVTLELRDAVDSFTIFAQKCQGLNPQTTSAELDEMTGYRKRGEGAMDRAVQMIEAAQDAVN